MFEDILNAILEQFTGPVTIGGIAASLIVAFAVSMLIVFVYRKTFSGVVYSRTSVMTIVLLAMVTAMIIRTINSNLSLSLGMVGALSIVRFRTAIKEPVDTAFMFWAITAGIMSGAGLYVVAIVGSIILGLFFYLTYAFTSKPASRYLLVVVYGPDGEAGVKKLLEQVRDKKLKSRSVTGSGVYEETYEISYSKSTDELMKALGAVNGVRNVNLVTYNNDFGN